MNRKIAPTIEYVSEAAAACLVTMVQGNMLAITMGHLLIASQTGVIAGIIASVSILAARAERRWVISLVLGVITAVVDYFVHPGMFGTVAVEAVVTGIAAALLSYIVGTAVRTIQRRRAAKNMTDSDA